MVGTAQRATEIADDAGRDGQPEAQPNTGGLGCEKRFEQVGQGFFGQPRTVVAHTQPGLTVDAGVARCERAVGSEREVYSVSLPAVITVKDGLNIPRYPSVPGRIKARKKEVSTHEVTLATPRIVKARLVVPAAAAKGTKVLDANEQGAAALVDVFREIGLLA